ncbi:insulinase family protein [Gordonia sp. PDNC005]|uniref:M16 family metallopeptidase n=1 Tax=Gordonia sp. PDNC005 TaxID=2811424 RepID=UPI001965316F|nr:insulinase family protein [Gordonia sp. PDNC005]QRY62429.1 insulinase family protein [Gordonia sp. PDNC005]
MTGDRVVRSGHGGLRVVAESRNVGTVAISVCVGVGYRSDPVGADGLAHLTEHTMYHGGRGKTEHARALAAVGGVYGANTLPDTTEFFCAAPASSVDDVLRLEAERMLNPLFDDGRIDRERDIVLHEVATVAAGHSSPDPAWTDQLRAHGLPPELTRDGFGSGDGFGALDAASVGAFHARNYGSDGTVIGVVGPEDAHILADRVLTAFAELPIGGAARPTVAEAPRPAALTSRTIADGEVVAASVLAPGGAVETAAHMILGLMLAEHRLAATVGRHGPFTADAPDIVAVRAASADRTGALERLVSALTAVVDRVGGPSPLDRARTRARLLHGGAHQVPVARARSSARGLLLTGRPDLEDRLSSALARVDENNVAAAANDLLGALR